MRVLITGGFGFIGSSLANDLSHLHDVTVIARYNATPCVALNDNIKVVYCESYANENAFNALDGIDVCFHLANRFTPAESNANMTSDVNENLISTLRLLNAIRYHNVRRIVYASSGGTVYGKNDAQLASETDTGKPLCAYGIVKLAIENYLYLYNHLYGIEYNILRLSNVYGVHQRLGTKQGAISAFIGRILQGEDIEIWGDGNVIRDYVYISDVVRAFAIAGFSHRVNNTYNVGSGVGYSLNDIIDELRIQFNEIDFAVNYKTARALDVPINVLDISKIRYELAWQSKITLRQGIKEMSHWARSIV